MAVVVVVMMEVWVSLTTTVAVALLAEKTVEVASIVLVTTMTVVASIVFGRKTVEVSVCCGSVMVVESISVHVFHEYVRGSAFLVLASSTSAQTPYTAHPTHKQGEGRSAQKRRHS
jgi:hypothetical protein